jgi:hypothetical protein
MDISLATHALAALLGYNAVFWQGKNGAPEEIRTPDPQIRSLVLYPAELRVRAKSGRAACVGDPLKRPLGECNSNSKKITTLVADG